MMDRSFCKRLDLTGAAAVVGVFVVLAGTIVYCQEDQTGNSATVDSLDPAREWGQLIASEKFDEAKTLCTRWLESGSVLHQTEAHKCLANVELSAASIVRLEGTKSGGALFPGYVGEGVDRAVEHLRQAISLSPMDLSIHQGRLHALLTSARYDQAIEALKESIHIYDGHDAVDVWLSYSPYFFEFHRFKEGVDFLKVVEESYPKDHRVVANIGAFLSLSERDDEALPYLKKAVALEPTDPVNTWNLARHYDFIGDIDNADRFYGRAISLAKTDDQKSEYLCVYSVFIFEKLKDAARACRLQEVHCPSEERPACIEEEQ